MTISIKQLTFKTIIGLLDHERVTPQTVIIDCDISYSYEHDDTFIDYALVVNLIESTMNKKKFKLIETALTVLINEIKSNFTLSQSISLTITKPDIIDNCQVSVSFQKSFL